MAAGWVKLHRSAESHPVLKNATRRGLFDRLLLRAAREACRVAWRGNTLSLAVGQLAISVREFAEDNELTYKETRLHLQRLEAEGMISLVPILGARKGAGKGAIGSLVTICNFSKFQLSESSRGAIEGALEGAVGAQWGRTEQEVRESEDKTLHAAAPSPATRAPAREETAPAEPAAAADDPLFLIIGKTGCGADEAAATWAALLRFAGGDGDLAYYGLHRAVRKGARDLLDYGGSVIRGEMGKADARRKSGDRAGHVTPEDIARQRGLLH